jgi:hypothetical protein
MQMTRLSLVLLLVALMGVPLVTRATSASRATVASSAATPYTVAQPEHSHSRRFPHFPGRGGRRCCDTVIAQGSGPCSE